MIAMNRTFARVVGFAGYGGSPQLFLHSGCQGPELGAGCWCRLDRTVCPDMMP